MVFVIGIFEFGGWMIREVICIFCGLEDFNFVGVDVVEVSLLYDDVGESIFLVVVQIVYEILISMVKCGCCEEQERFSVEKGDVVKDEF